MSKGIPKLIQIPAIRKISDGDYALDGRGIIPILSQWKNPDIGKDADEEKFKRVVQFLQHLLEMDNIDLEIPPENRRLVIRRGSLRLPLMEYYGTGVHELVILAVAVLQEKDKLIAIEEPEIHLHPRLQRELLRFLIEKTENKYLITTHSPAFLSQPQHCHIVRLWLEDGITRSKPVDTTETALEVLRDLGISAADIMQTRFVIWVEGPSDAIYLRRWIHLAFEEKIAKEILIEGIDFSIMFYGGACLPHLSLVREAVEADDDDEDDDEEAKKLIEILRINQNSAVVMDSDRKTEGDAVRKPKLRVQGECNKSNLLSWITEGREIENYLPTEAIYAAYRAELNEIEFNFTLGQWEKIDEQVEGAIPKHEWKAKFNYAKKKTTWAHKIAPHIKSLDVLDLRERIVKLVSAIQAAK